MGRYSKSTQWVILLVFVTLFIASITSSSCSSNPNKANILPPDVQYMADTMFSHRRRSIELEMESICQEMMPFLVEQARDSLVAIEQEHIKSIIGDE